MVNKERIIHTFLELVQIDSETGKEQEIQPILKSKFQSLGLNVVEDNANEDPRLGANNLICTLASNINKNDIDKIYFSSHMDTVVPGVNVKPTINDDGYIYSDGTTVLGADDKAGLAALIELIQVMQEQNTPHGQIQFIITVGEESSLLGAKAINSELIDADFGYAVDASSPIGSTVIAAPTQMKVDATIYGKTAHASVPDQGVSAINIAAKAISKMHLGKIDEETTANIGRFEGGSATNIVANKVTLNAEARSHSDEKVESQVAHMKSVFENTAQSFGCSADVRVTKSYPGFQIDENDHVIDIAKKSASSLGLNPKAVIANGGSDGNIFNLLGVPTVIIGIGYENIHTTKERIATQNLVLLAQQLLKIVELVTNESN
ncbi:M20/M25/M40 family metallo-hydrolase [Staphylococcus sp. Marseille-Q5304]|uniref:M20/M25/M40 family metallo-hydrolase n=1 Tax=Staphylococcus sp. Marseille-Q5304 TaxID=2942200 RepID=UPI002074AA1E|nr:M20/M25/M40 family metallo-hydrolase [Staphylococcus sp. Marseille-Q5304]